VTIIADPGTAQVQKSDIFKIKHKNVLSNLSLSNGVVDVRVDNLPAGSYAIKGLTAATTAAITAGGGINLVQRFGENIFRLGVTYGTVTRTFYSSQGAIDSAVLWSAGHVNSVGVSIAQPGNASDYSGYYTATMGGDYYKAINSSTVNKFGHMSGTAKILLEVTNVDTSLGVVTMKAVALVTRADGTSQTFVQDGLTVTTSNGLNWTAFGIAASKSAGGGNILNNLASKAQANALGSKAVISIIDLSGTGVVISGKMNSDWDESWGSGALKDAKFALKDINNKDLALRNFYLNTVNGQVYEHNVTLVLDENFRIADKKSGNATIATFEATYIGQTARMDTQLRDLDKFWDANGKFLLDDAQTLSITQGDGKTAKVTLYATDTIKDVVNKLNNAIAYGLE